MNGAVRFERIGDEYLVSFRYDETAIAVVKALPP
jgi:hypothetical protein